jgi:formylglycine-generating enzyme required for sulfatase activity
MLLRGGSWNLDPRDCRSALRGRIQPGNAINSVGFRVVCLQEVTLPRTRMLLRGGSWLSNPRDCRSAHRYFDQPDLADSFIGFRVVCLPPSPSPNSPQT